MLSPSRRSMTLSQNWTLDDIGSDPFALILADVAPVTAHRQQVRLMTADCWGLRNVAVTGHKMLWG